MKDTKNGSKRSQEDGGKGRRPKADLADAGGGEDWKAMLGKIEPGDLADTEIPAASPDNFEPAEGAGSPLEAQQSPDAAASPDVIAAANKDLAAHAGEVVAGAGELKNDVLAVQPPAGTEVPPVAQSGLENTVNAAEGAAATLTEGVTAIAAESLGATAVETPGAAKNEAEPQPIGQVIYGEKRKKENIYGRREDGSVLMKFNVAGPKAKEPIMKDIWIQKGFFGELDAKKPAKPDAAPAPIQEAAAAAPAEGAIPEQLMPTENAQSAAEKPIKSDQETFNDEVDIFLAGYEELKEMLKSVEGKISADKFNRLDNTRRMYSQESKKVLGIRELKDQIIAIESIKNRLQADLDSYRKLVEQWKKEFAESAAVEPLLEPAAEPLVSGEMPAPVTEPAAEPAETDEFAFDSVPEFRPEAADGLPEDVFAQNRSEADKILESWNRAKAEKLEEMNRPAVAGETEATPAGAPGEQAPNAEALPTREAVDVEYRRYTTRENILKRFISHKFERLANWTDRITGYKSGDWGNAQYDLVGRSIVRVKNFFTGKLFDSRNKSVMKAESKLNDLRDRITEQEAENEINREIRDNSENSYQDRKRAAKAYESGFKKLNGDWLRSGLRFEQAKHLSKVGKLESMKETTLNGINERSLKVSRDIEEHIKPTQEKLEQAKMVLQQAEQARDEAAAERAGWQTKLDNLKIRMMSVPKDQRALVKQAINSCNKVLTKFDKKYNEADIGLTACQEHIGHLESLINPWQDMSTMYQEITDKQVYVSDEEKPSYNPVSARIKPGQGRRFGATESIVGENQRISVGKYLKEVNDNLGFGAREFTADEITAVLGADAGADSDLPLADLENRVKPVLTARGLSEKQIDDLLNLTRVSYQPNTILNNVESF